MDQHTLNVAPLTRDTTTYRFWKRNSVLRLTGPDIVLAGATFYKASTALWEVIEGRSAPNTHRSDIVVKHYWTSQLTATFWHDQDPAGPPWSGVNP